MIDILIIIRLRTDLQRFGFGFLVFFFFFIDMLINYYFNEIGWVIYIFVWWKKDWFKGYEMIYIGIVEN